MVTEKQNQAFKIIIKNNTQTNKKTNNKITTPKQNQGKNQFPESS